MDRISDICNVCFRMTHHSVKQIFSKEAFQLYGYIVDVYCIPDKRRNGYAAQIMTELIKWLQGKGVHSVSLKPSEAERHLYEKIGFHDSGKMEMFI